MSTTFCSSQRYRGIFVSIWTHQLANYKARPPWVLSLPGRMTDISCFQLCFSTTPGTQSIKYHWIDGVESLKLYKLGGYHPVAINDLLHKRYRIVDKLGFGGYSTVWLARDEIGRRYVAVKIGISSTHLPRRELEILRALNSSRASLQEPPACANAGRSSALPTILDAFEVQGSNGMHPCYTLTPAQGNLKEASFSRLFPVKVARALAAKLATAVATVHSQGFVHGDIHLRNVLVNLPSTFDELSISNFREKFGEPETVPVSRVDGEPLTPNIPTHAVVPPYLGKKAQEFTLEDSHGLILSDFGEAFSPATEPRLGSECNTPLAKRAPETLFEPDNHISYPSDIWSLGTAIWEILGMKFIFSESETQDEIVAQQIDVLGPSNFPESWRKEWERLDEEGEEGNTSIPRRQTGVRETWPRLDNAFEEFVQKYRRKREAAGTCEDQEVLAILDLMRRMLRFRPEERLTIDEVLQSEWMVKWALPELK